MPKQSTCPIIFDEVLKIKISDLKRFGYLKYGLKISTDLTWNRNGQKIADIDIIIDMDRNAPYMELNYRCNNKPINYCVKIISMTSNLGKGEVFYFQCPQTMKKCRVLYQVGGYFLHREAFTGCMYEKQTESKRARTQTKMIDTVFRTDVLYEQLYSKHFKKMYAGKPTKKYIKLMKKIRQAESVPYYEIERLLSR